MQRALSSGVTGMLTNQLALDVTSNNLANVNTPGFKGSRVTFATSLIQTTFAGAAAGNNVGGQNPRQVGLGVDGASIEVDMSQGALQATGRTLDLAIQGAGFFEVTDGTRSFYTRVGNFGLDEANNLVHLSTGYRLIGNRYNLDVDNQGNQSLASTAEPLEVPVDDAFPPRRTSEVEFQGNLNSNTPALRGANLSSIFPLRDTLINQTATEETALLNLDLFNGDPVPPSTLPGGTPEDDIVTMYIFGTRPDGEAYAGTFQISPWAPITPGSNRGTVGELVGKLNNVFSQGSDRFANARIENGNLLVTSIGSGDGFSVFFGEGQPDVDPTGARISSNNPIPEKVQPIPNPVDVTGRSQNVVPAPNLDGEITTAAALDMTFNGLVQNQSTSGGVVPIPVGSSGLLDPMFTIQSDISQAIGISVRINGVERGNVLIPPANYGSGGLDPRQQQFRLSSFPHVSPGDEVEYRVITSDSSSPVLSVATDLVSDDVGLNLTNDANGDGIPNMFQEGGGTDAHAWQYLNETNGIFDWYRSRLVPEFVSSSIQVYDAQGGRHTVEARYFRVGTRTEPGSGAQINSWDVLVNVNQQRGELVDDLVTGIEFDQSGRFMGINATIFGTALSELTHVGRPSNQSIQVDWNATGPTTPATMFMNFGQSRTFNGLTGFGSASTASAVSQDGYGDGKLDSLSVTPEGDIVALYTNGISRKLVQLPLTTFRNPEGLTGAEGNLWQRSTASGDPIRRVPGENAGFITGSALEGSNVDIATEFTKLITSQRGFQVSARVIQTTDRILEELANLTR